MRCGSTLWPTSVYILAREKPCNRPWGRFPTKLTTLTSLHLMPGRLVASRLNGTTICGLLTIGGPNECRSRLPKFRFSSDGSATFSTKCSAVLFTARPAKITYPTNPRPRANNARRRLKAPVRAIGDDGSAANATARISQGLGRSPASSNMRPCLRSRISF